MIYPLEDYDDDDWDDPGDDDEYLDCHLGPDGQCAAAGSEECDRECPYSHGEHYAGSELWNKAHDAGVPIDGCMCSECREARQFKHGLAPLPEWVIDRE